MVRFLSILFGIVLCYSVSLFAQESSTEPTEKNNTLTVFLDCRGCDDNFIRTEIKFVNFVRDQGLADLHLFIVRQGTANGAQFLIEYIDQRTPDKTTKNLVFDSFDFQTNEEVRNGLVTTIELGLVSYLRGTEVYKQLSVNYTPTSENQSFEENDPWNNWVFDLGMGTNFSGEERQWRYNINGDGAARRITDEWKIVFNVWGNFNRRAVDQTEERVINGDTVEVEVTEFFDRSNRNYWGLIAKSINDHWSVGFYSRYRSDTFLNIDTQLGITPSLEYSLFPYREFTRREVTARIGVVASYFNYSEITVLLEEEEFLWRPEFDLTADFTQPWGRFRAGFEGGAYLNDLSLNRFEFDTRVNLRVSKYFSVFFSGRYSIIGDQISLPAGNLTTEEILAGVSQQATSFDFGGSFGIEIQFGSIYNNIVNPRL